MSGDDDPIKPEHVRRFVRLAKGMDKLLDEIAEYCPGSNLYFANETWNLMRGPSHDEKGDFSRQENVVESVLVKRSGGGDW